METSKVAWYNTGWLMWLTLLLFAPVGIILLWKNSKFNKNIKLIISSVSALFFISVLITGALNKGTPVDPIVAPVSRVQSDDVASKNPLPKTIDEIAKLENAIINEEQKIYYYETNKIGADGVNKEIGGMSIISLKYYESFDVLGEILTDAIVFEVASDTKDTKGFLQDKAFVNVYDINGDSSASFSSFYWNDSDNEKLYMIFTPDISMESYSHVVLGGFFPEKNKNFSKVVFPLQ